MHISVWLTTVCGIDVNGCIYVYFLHQSLCRPSSDYSQSLNAAFASVEQAIGSVTTVDDSGDNSRELVNNQGCVDLEDKWQRVRSVISSFEEKE